MINPEIKKVYGENGEKVIADIISIFTDEERNAAYAVGYSMTSPVDGMPHHIGCDRPDLVSIMTNKLINYSLSLDEDDETLLVCYNLCNGEGVKVWLTT